MPKEYIEREAAIDAIMSDPPDAHYPYWYIDRIKTLSAADVEEVIRCKDCKHLRFSYGCGCGICALFNHYPNGDWYCASGERKEGAD